MDNDQINVPERIAGVPVELRPPERLDERWDLYLAMDETEGRTGQVLRVLAAAMALCWPALRERLQAERIRYKGDALQYGGDVIHYLLSLERPERPLPGWQPVSMDQITATGRAAHKLVLDSVVTEDQVQEQVDFSGAPEEPSRSGSSRSNATGANVPDGSAPSTPNAQPG